MIIIYTNYTLLEMQIKLDSLTKIFGLICKKENTNKVLKWDFILNKKKRWFELNWWQFGLNIFGIY